MNVKFFLFVILIVGISFSRIKTDDVEALDSIKGVSGSFSGALTGATLNTGNGANELYEMDQNVTTTSSVDFFNIGGTYTNYSSISTVTGWSNFTIKLIYYKKIGKAVFINFIISGTSNSTFTRFTLPYNNSSSINTQFTFAGIDNSTVLPSVGIGSCNSNIVEFYPNCNFDLWTNSGIKTIRGSFFYIAN